MEEVKELNTNNTNKELNENDVEDWHCKFWLPPGFEEEGIKKYANILGKWIPVKVTMHYNGFRIPLVKKDVLKNGLLLMYIKKEYSQPPAFRFAVDKQLLECGNYICTIPYNTLALARITLKKSRFPKYGTCKFNILNIELIKSSREIVPKYHLVIIRKFGKRVSSGASANLKCTKGCENVLWYTSESSGSGAHWYAHYALLLKQGDVTTFRYNYHGANRPLGTYDITISFDGITTQEVK